MADLAVSRRAMEELGEIWDYIALDNSAAADRVLLRIESKLQVLSEFPEIGTQRDDIRPGVRMLVEGNYLLLYEYRKADGIVELVTVVDGRRDLQGWL